MEAIELANGVQLEHPPGSLRWNAQQLLLSGEVPSIKEIADRLDGKPVQPIAGSDDDPPIGIPMQSLDLAGLTNEQISGLRALFAGVVAIGDGASS